MFYKREGLPEEGEIIFCQVTKIYPNSVFVKLLEYNDSGMIHISEVSPGRIRNLRDYVSIGRQVVCKVLRLDRQRGHIDLSLRRVNSTQRREKLDEIKQELKSEQLIKNLSKKIKKSAEQLYEEISSKIFEEYSHLYLCFRAVVEEEVDLIKLGLDKKLADELKVAILDKFKQKKITIKGEIHLYTYAQQGVEKLKSALNEIEKISSTISLSYLGAGRYKLVIEDVDYKPAEETLKGILNVIKQFEDKESTASFTRDKSD